VKCGHRHIRSPTAVGLDPCDTALIEGALTHLVDQAHPLDHIAACTTQVDGLSAWADSVGQLDDRYAITTVGQPEGQCRSRDSGSADQDGPLCHGR
jgi:hypothetical protein